MPNTDQLNIEQYKLFVQMADQVSERRLKTNQFYIGIISGILASLAFILHDEKLAQFGRYQNIVILAVVVLGLTLNIIWFINIKSFRILNSGKFEIIHQMELSLPLKPYTDEWKIIKENPTKVEYLQLTRIEQILPFVMALPFLILGLLIII